MARTVPACLEKCALPPDMSGALPDAIMISALRVREIRERQLREGNFDCFGRATTGYCDQHGCLHHAECTGISKAMPELARS